MNTVTYICNKCNMSSAFVNSCYHCNRDVMSYREAIMMLTIAVAYGMVFAQFLR